MTETRVVFGAQGVRSVDWAGRGVGRMIARLVEATARVAPDRVAGTDLGAFPSATEPSDLEGLDPRPRLVDPHARPAGEGLLYHVLAPFEPGSIDRIWPSWARAADVPLVVTVYDLIPLRDPDAHLADPSARRAYHLRLELLRTADALCAVSEPVAADLVDRVGIDERRVHLCGLGPSRTPAPPGTSPPAGLPADPRAAILAVLGEGERKNADGLLAAYAELPSATRERMPLLLCGLDVDRRGDIPRGAHVLPRLSEQDLAALQAACRATIHPALDEGFGLPVLDALAAGGAVCVSDVPVLAGLVPDPQARFDPRSREAMTAALECLADDEFVARRRAQAAAWAAPHTWEAVVASVLDAHAAARARRRSGPRRPRLAVLTPLPPDRTGVATFERHRLAALAELADVDVFAEAVDGPPEPLPGARVLHGELVTAATQVGAYDTPVLHVLGNSAYHLRAWAHLMEHGGDVLLHDVRLVGLYGLLTERGLVPPREDARTDELMCGPVVDRARRVLVHSEAARRLVLAERPERAGDVHVVPLAAPVGAPPAAAADGREVAAFGYVRDAERLVGAFAALLDREPSARPVVVGAPPAGHAEILAGLVADAGIAASLEITGWVDVPTWERRLRGATVALQLRDGWNGEASGTVAECLAAGVPTIVNDVGAYEDVPDDALVRVPADASADELAETVVELLDDAERRTRIAAAAHAFAARTSTREAAAALLAAVSGSGSR